MIEQEDMDTIKSLKRFRAKKKQSFNSVINSRELSDEEMDDLFLSA